MQECGHKAAFYHGSMEPAQRASIQMQWSKDEINIICATVAFGMGITNDCWLVAWIVNILQTIVFKYLFFRYQQTRCAVCNSSFPSKINWRLSSGINQDESVYWESCYC